MISQGYSVYDNLYKFKFDTVLLEMPVQLHDRNIVNKPRYMYFLIIIVLCNCTCVSLGGPYYDYIPLVIIADSSQVSQCSWFSILHSSESVFNLWFNELAWSTVFSDIILWMNVLIIKVFLTAFSSFIVSGLFVAELLYILFNNCYCWFLPSNTGLLSH